MWIAVQYFKSAIAKTELQSYHTGMYNLFLDDERMPEHVTWVNIGPGPWTIVRTQNDFQNHILEHGLPANISFDNDLGIGDGEGRDCAKWLVAQWLDGTLPLDPEFTFTVHSMNFVAVEWINQYLRKYLEHVRESN